MQGTLWRARILLSSLVYSLCVVPLLCAEAVSGLELRFCKSETDLLVVPVQVNGGGPYRFIVDTGSSHSTIASELAADLGAPRVAKTMVSTATGEGWAAVTRLERVSLGPLTATAVLATEMPASSMGGDDVLGVIGRDILEQRSFTIDYRRNVLSWEVGSGSAEPVDTFLPIDASGPVWRVSVHDRSGTAHLMVPDSGAGGVVLFDRGQWSGLRYQGGTTRVNTVTSGTNGRQGELPRMNIGSVALENQAVVIIDGAHVPATHGDGLLPLRAFARVTFDLRHERVLLTGNDANAE